MRVYMSVLTCFAVAYYSAAARNTRYLCVPYRPEHVREYTCTMLTRMACYR